MSKRRPSLKDVHVWHGSGIRWNRRQVTACFSLLRCVRTIRGPLLRGHGSGTAAWLWARDASRDSSEQVDGGFEDIVTSLRSHKNVMFSFTHNADVLDRNLSWATPFARDSQ